MLDIFLILKRHHFNFNSIKKYFTKKHDTFLVHFFQTIKLLKTFNLCLTGVAGIKFCDLLISGLNDKFNDCDIISLFFAFNFLRLSLYNLSKTKFFLFCFLIFFLFCLHFFFFFINYFYWFERTMFTIIIICNFFNFFCMFIPPCH